MPEEPWRQAEPQAPLTVLLQVDPQDTLGTMQQQQGPQADGVRVAQPLAQGVQALLRHLQELLGAPVQLLQEQQTLSAPGVRRLWGWGRKHKHTVRAHRDPGGHLGAGSTPQPWSCRQGPTSLGSLGQDWELMCPRPGWGRVSWERSAVCVVSGDKLSEGWAGGVVSSTPRRERGHISTSSLTRDSTDDLDAPSTLMPPESWLPQTQNVGPGGSCSPCHSRTHGQSPQEEGTRPRSLRK